MNERSLPSDLDLYLDGLMTPEQAAAFKRVIDTDPRLAAEVRLQTRIDASLSSQFDYPRGLDTAVPDAPSLPFEAPARRAPRWGRILGFTAVAACASMLVWFGNPFAPLPPVVEPKRLTACDVYKNLETANWVPSFKCNSDEEFVVAVAKQLGSGLLIPLSTVGVTLDGWGYADGYAGSPISGETMYLLTHVGEKRVLVLMDRKANDQPVQSGTCSLNVFRREVGDLVLYEVSPNAASTASDAAVPR